MSSEWRIKIRLTPSFEPEFKITVRCHDDVAVISWGGGQAPLRLETTKVEQDSIVGLARETLAETVTEVDHPPVEGDVFWDTLDGTSGVLTTTGPNGLVKTVTLHKRAWMWTESDAPASLQLVRLILQMAKKAAPEDWKQRLACFEYRE